MQVGDYIQIPTMDALLEMGWREDGPRMVKNVHSCLQSWILLEHVGRLMPIDGLPERGSSTDGIHIEDGAWIYQPHINELLNYSKNDLFRFKKRGA